MVFAAPAGPWGVALVITADRIWLERPVPLARLTLVSTRSG